MARKFGEFEIFLLHKFTCFFFYGVFHTATSKYIRLISLVECNKNALLTGFFHAEQKFYVWNDFVK